MVIWRQAAMCLCIAWVATRTGRAAARQVLFIGSGSTDTVGKYDARTGAAINSSLINGQGLSGPGSMAVDGNNHLFVVSTVFSGFEPPWIVGQYDATTGVTINANFLTVGRFTFGLAAEKNNLFVPGYFSGIQEYDSTSGSLTNSSFNNSPFIDGIALDGLNHLYVINHGTTSGVGKYDSTTGASINASLVTGVEYPGSVAVDAMNHLFVTYGNNGANDTIGEFDASTGAPIRPKFIAGFVGPMAVDDQNHFFIITNGSTVAEYDITTGNLLNPAFVSGLSGASSILFVAPVPEPSSLPLTVAAVTAAALHRRRKARTAV